MVIVLLHKEPREFRDISVLDRQEYTFERGRCDIIQLKSFENVGPCFFYS